MHAHISCVVVLIVFIHDSTQSILKWLLLNCHRIICTTARKRWTGEVKLCLFPL